MALVPPGLLQVLLPTLTKMVGGATAPLQREPGPSPPPLPGFPNRGPIAPVWTPFPNLGPIRPVFNPFPDRGPIATPPLINPTQGPIRPFGTPFPDLGPIGAEPLKRRIKAFPGQGQTDPFERETLGDQFDLINQDTGDKFGTLKIRKEGPHAHIGFVGAAPEFDESAPFEEGGLGNRDVSNVIGQWLLENPEIKTIGGSRMTGALGKRPEAFKEGGQLIVRTDALRKRFIRSKANPKKGFSIDFPKLSEQVGAAGDIEDPVEATLSTADRRVKAARVAQEVSDLEQSFVQGVISEEVFKERTGRLMRESEKLGLSGRPIARAFRERETENTRFRRAVISQDAAVKIDSVEHRLDGPKKRKMFIREAVNQGAKLRDIRQALQDLRKRKAQRAIQTRQRLSRRGKLREGSEAWAVDAAHLDDFDTSDDFFLEQQIQDQQNQPDPLQDSPIESGSFFRAEPQEFVTGGPLPARERLARRISTGRISAESKARALGEKLKPRKRLSPIKKKKMQEATRGIDPSSLDFVSALSRLRGRNQNITLTDMGLFVQGARREWLRQQSSTVEEVNVDEIPF